MHIYIYIYTCTYWRLEEAVLPDLGERGVLELREEPEERHLSLSYS